MESVAPVSCPSADAATTSTTGRRGASAAKVAEQSPHPNRSKPARQDPPVSRMLHFRVNPRLLNALSLFETSGGCLQFAGQNLQTGASGQPALKTRHYSPVVPAGWHDRPNCLRRTSRKFGRLPFRLFTGRPPAFIHLTGRPFVPYKQDRLVTLFAKGPECRETATASSLHWTFAAAPRRPVGGQTRPVADGATPPGCSAHRDRSGGGAQSCIQPVAPRPPHSCSANPASNSQASSTTMPCTGSCPGTFRSTGPGANRCASGCVPAVVAAASATVAGFARSRQRAGRRVSQTGGRDAGCPAARRCSSLCREPASSLSGKSPAQRLER